MMISNTPKREFVLKTMLPLLIRRRSIKMIKHYPHISGYTNAPQYSATMKPRVGGVQVASSSPFCSDRNRFQFKPSKNGRRLGGGRGGRGKHISSFSSHKDGEKDDDTRDDDDAENDVQKYYSAKAIRRGFMDKTVKYDKKYLYHGRKRVYQGEDEDDVNDDKQQKKKIPVHDKERVKF